MKTLFFVILTMTAPKAALATPESMAAKNAVRAGVPESAVKAAFEELEKGPTKFANRRYMVFVDFSKNLSEDRFYVVNLETNEVSRTAVSHGLGSDPELRGIATMFSDRDGSNASSLGFYQTLDTYSGEYGYSLRVRGLSSTNKSAFKRLIVVHGYPVGPGYNQASCKRGKVLAGRPQSQKYCLPTGALTRGCFGISNTLSRKIIDQIKGGALLFAFNGPNLQ